MTDEANENIPEPKKRLPSIGDVAAHTRSAYDIFLETLPPATLTVLRWLTALLRAVIAALFQTTAILHDGSLEASRPIMRG